MRHWGCAILLLGLVAGRAGATADAPESPRALTAQQQRMKDCNAKANAEGLRRDARRSFMKTCLSGGKVEVQFGEDPAPPEPGLSVAPAEGAEAAIAAEADTQAGARWPASSPRPKNPRLGPCIGEARSRDLKGTERKTFMSNCLKSDAH